MTNFTNDQIVIARAYLREAADNAMLAIRGEDFYRDMNRRLLVENVKRAAMQLGLVVSEREAEGAGALRVVPAPSLPCDVEDTMGHGANWAEPFDPQKQT
jgi:hypothetical protein